MKDLKPLLFAVVALAAAATAASAETLTAGIGQPPVIQVEGLPCDTDFCVEAVCYAPLKLEPPRRVQWLKFRGEGLAVWCADREQGECITATGAETVRSIVNGTMIQTLVVTSAQVEDCE